MKTQRPAISINFLKVQWSGAYWDISSKVKEKSLDTDHPPLRERLLLNTIRPGRFHDLAISRVDNNVVWIL